MKMNSKGPMHSVNGLMLLTRTAYVRNENEKKIYDVSCIIRKRKNLSRFPMLIYLMYWITEEKFMIFYIVYKHYFASI